MELSYRFAIINGNTTKTIMTADNTKLNVLLIGENIETRIVFKNALYKLDRLCSIDDHYCLDKAVSNPFKLRELKPDIIFLDTNANNCSDEVRKIRDFENFRDCSLVVYDSYSRLSDTDGIFSEGADVFINQPYDFPRLKKVIGNIVNTNWDVSRFTSNRQYYFL